MTKILAYGYLSESAQQELSNEYQHERVLDVFQISFLIVLWAKVGSAFEGLILVITSTIVCMDL